MPPEVSSPALLLLLASGVSGQSLQPLNRVPASGLLLPFLSVCFQANHLPKCKSGVLPPQCWRGLESAVCRGDISLLLPFTSSSHAWLGQALAGMPFSSRSGCSSEPQPWPTRPASALQCAVAWFGVSGLLAGRPLHSPVGSLETVSVNPHVPELWGHCWGCSQWPVFPQKPVF